MNAHSALVPVPWVPKGFFPCCLRRKLSGEAAIVTSGFFFPLVTIAASPLNFRHKQQEKKPSDTQGIVLASIAVQCVKRKTHLSKYYKETCAPNFSCSYYLYKAPTWKEFG